MKTEVKTINDYTPFLPVFSFFNELIEDTLSRVLVWKKHTDERYYTGKKQSRLTLIALTDKQGKIKEYCLERSDNNKIEILFLARREETHFSELEALYRAITQKAEEIPESLDWYYNEKPRYFLENRNPTVLDIFKVFDDSDLDHIAFNVADNLMYFQEKEWRNDEDDCQSYDVWDQKTLVEWERYALTARSVIDSIMKTDSEELCEIAPQEITICGDDTMVKMFRRANIPSEVNEYNVGYMLTRIHEELYKLFWENVTMLPVAMQNRHRSEALIDTAVAIVSAIVETKI